MLENGFITFAESREKRIRNRNNAIVPPTVARVREYFKPLAEEFGKRISHFETTRDSMLADSDWLTRFFETVPDAIIDLKPNERSYGILPGRLDLIRDALGIYRAMSTWHQN